MKKQNVAKSAEDLVEEVSDWVEQAATSEESNDEGKLQKLIEIARSRGDKIFVVNEDKTSYLPVSEINFPVYEDSARKMHEAATAVLSGSGVPYTQKDIGRTVDDTVGTLEDWAKEYLDKDTLYEDSTFGEFITEKEDYIDSDDVVWGHFYFNLELPDEVKPTHDPFEEEAKRWKAKYQVMLGE